MEALASAAKTLQCEVTEMVNRPCPTDATRKCGVVLVRRVAENDFLELRVAVCGNVDSGKSTFVSVLTYGGLDNGRGSARELVCNHHHEVTTGRTSSVSQQMIGFDKKGQILNYSGTSPLPRDEIAARSAKIVTMYDLAGHEKYLKTTVHSITGSIPDYAFVIVSANNGVQRMTKEHLGICLAMKVPLVFIITRIDACPQPVFKETVQTVQKLLKQAGVRKMPYMVHTIDDVLICARHVKADRVVPIFCVSNVTGEGLDNVRAFLNLCPVRKDWETAQNAPAEVVLESTFFITGVGTVVSGIVTQGKVTPGDTMMLGPDANGNFRPVQIKTVQCRGINMSSVHAGNCAGFALKKEKRSAIRKGMVLLDAKTKPLAVWEFDAEILVLYHSTTIKANYQPVVHCRTIRQSAKIVKMENGDGASLKEEGEEEACIRTGDKAIVRFRFLYHAEYVLSGMRMVFREGRTKGIGTVVNVFEGASPNAH
jgi:GTPase